MELNQNSSKVVNGSGINMNMPQETINRTFIDLDHSQIIFESFTNFLSLNSIDTENIKSQLTREKFMEWNFTKFLEENKGVNLTNESFLNQIPNLTEYFSNNEQSINGGNSISNIQDLKQGRLVKFNCMVQNVFENQLYMAIGFEKSGNLIINKFHEYSIQLNSNSVPHESSQANGMAIDYEENLYTPDEDFSATLLSERLSLNCVILPGISPSLCNQLCISQESLQKLSKKKIIVYDYENSSHKVNEEILVTGVAYEYDNEIIIHSWKIIKDYISKKLIPAEYVTENGNISSTEFLANFNFSLARQKIYIQLLNIFNNDELLAEYLILFITSQIYSRVGTHFIGKMSLNIINQTESLKNMNNYNDYFTLLHSFIQMISNFTLSLTPTISSLNNSILCPRFDVNTEELVQGLLQTPRHTFLLIDERQMNEGKLLESGVKNFNTLKELIDFQVINYDYPYSKVEIAHDTQILTVTDKVKSMFNSMELIQIPFLNKIEMEVNSGFQKLNLNSSNSNGIDFSFLPDFRIWFNLTRNSDCFTKNFNIKEEISEKVQKDFLERKDDFTVDDLGTCLKLARLYAISFGRDCLKFEDYLHAKEIEKIRKERLASMKKY